MLTPVLHPIPTAWLSPLKPHRPFIRFSCSDLPPTIYSLCVEHSSCLCIFQIQPVDDATQVAPSLSTRWKRFLSTDSVSSVGLSAMPNHTQSLWWSDYDFHHQNSSSMTAKLGLTYLTYLPKPNIPHSTWAQSRCSININCIYLLCSRHLCSTHQGLTKCFKGTNSFNTETNSIKQFHKFHTRSIWQPIAPSDHLKCGQCDKKTTFNFA